MIMQIIPIRPNPRDSYQRRVVGLCNLLKDEEGKRYRVSVFRLLGITSRTFKKKGLNRFREFGEARHFLHHQYPADVRALEIMAELDTLYDAPEGEIDHLRGAVGEVLSYFVCCKLYSNADIEVQVKIEAWTSESIDTAGCNHKRGHCLQSKYSLTDLGSIRRQKSDLDTIEKLTGGKAQGAFITYTDRTAFFQALNVSGIDPSSYRVFDRSDLLVLEERLMSS